MKKKLSLIVLALICIISSACSSKSSPKQFDQFGISFTYPANWKLNKVDDLGGGYYISLEKSGFSSSGLLVIVVMDEEWDLYEYMTIFQEELIEQPVFSGVNFSDEYEAWYGEYEGIHTVYTVSVLNMPHEGRQYVFESNGRTVYVCEQEAVEDHSKNLDGFNMVEGSFMVE